MEALSNSDSPSSYSETIIGQDADSYSVIHPFSPLHIEMEMIMDLSIPDIQPAFRQHNDVEATQETELHNANRHSNRQSSYRSISDFEVKGCWLLFVMVVAFFGFFVSIPEIVIGFVYLNEEKESKYMLFSPAQWLLHVGFIKLCIMFPLLMIILFRKKIECCMGCLFFIIFWFGFVWTCIGIHMLMNDQINLHLIHLRNQILASVVFNCIGYFFLFITEPVNMWWNGD
jgi:hypothetical protein